MAAVSLLWGAVSGLSLREARRPGCRDVHASWRNALVRRGVVPVVPAWWASRPHAWEHLAAPPCGIDNPASQGGPPAKGHADGACAVDRGSSCILLSLAMVRRAGGPKVHSVVCAILLNFLRVSGLQVVRLAYLPGALDVLWAPSGPLGILHGGLASAGVSRIRTIAE